MSLRYSSAVISTANPNKDGTGTIVELVVGTAHGSRVETIIIKSQAATTAGMIRFFVEISSSWEVFAEVPVSESDNTATSATFATQLKMPSLYVGHNQRIGVSTENAETFTVTAMCADM